MKIFILLFLVFLVTATTALTFGQGCSDAGFCTMNTFKPNSSDSSISEYNQVKAGMYYGIADYSISVLGNYLEYNRQLSDKAGLDFKLTTLLQSGNGISAFGLSDVFANAYYKWGETITITAGAKLPLSDGNKKKDNLSLPMDYQSSLGTFDFIAGIGYEVKRLQLVFAYQQPLTDNKNEFIAEMAPDDSPLRSFQSTNKYKRSGDVLLRVSLPLPVGEKMVLTPSVLPVYHLADDRYTDVNGIENDIPGSQGLTLNVNIYADYELNPNFSLQLNIAAPVVVREARPDGLTRSFIANIEGRIKF